MHGWGVVCGLTVVPVSTKRHPWRVGICPGYGIDKHGHEVYLTRRIDVDVARYAWRRRLSHGRDLAVVTVEASERPIKRVSVDHTVCCERRYTRNPHSRTKDEVRVRIEWFDRSQIASVPGVDICDADVVACMPCPQSAEISLAVLHLPTRDSEKIEARHIQNL